MGREQRRRRAKAMQAAPRVRHAGMQALLAGGVVGREAHRALGRRVRDGQAHRLRGARPSGVRRAHGRRPYDGPGHSLAGARQDRRGARGRPGARDRRGRLLRLRRKRADGLWAARVLLQAATANGCPTRAGGKHHENRGSVRQRPGLPALRPHAGVQGLRGRGRQGGTFPARPA